MGICITDKNGFFVNMNQKYTDIYGWSKEELLDKHFTTVVPEENKNRLNTMHNEFIKNEFEIIRNWEVQKKDKTRIKIQADAGWSDRIYDGTPHKITFVFLVEG